MTSINLPYWLKQLGLGSKAVGQTLVRLWQANSSLLQQRRIWLNLHIWLALTVGFILALLGATGSVSIYREEIDQLLNPQLVINDNSGNYQSLDKIMAAIKKAHPDRHGEWTLEMPLAKDEPITAWFEKPRETFFKRYAPLMVSVNPYTSEVIASRLWGETFSTWLVDLHSQLLLEDLGWDIVGVCSAVLMLSVISGLYLWWPGFAHLIYSFKINSNQGLIRVLFDIHKMLGVVMAGALLILAFTGMQLSFPKLLEKVAGTTGMAHGETGKPIMSTAIPNNHPTVLEAARFIAQAPFPKAELRRVTTPAGTSGVYRINLRQKIEVNHKHPYTTVWLDQWSGQIREVRDPRSFNTGATLITWIWPVHTGEALGKWGRFIWFLAGQSLLILYITGLMRWLYRHGKIKDREVDFNKLKHRIKITGQQLWESLANKVIPLLAKLGKKLWRELQQHWQNYRPGN